MGKRDLYVALFLIMFSITAYLEALSYPYKSAYFSRIIIVLMAVMGCILLGKTIIESKKESGVRRPEKEGERETIPLWKQSVVRKVAIMIACSMIYLIILSLVGFFATTLVYLPVMIWLLGIRKLKTIAFSTIFVVVFIYMIFGAFLRVPLPQGVAY
jgi:hypothetical protein